MITGQVIVKNKYIVVLTANICHKINDVYCVELVTLVQSYNSVLSLAAIMAKKALLQHFKSNNLTITFTLHSHIEDFKQPHEAFIVMF